MNSHWFGKSRIDAAGYVDFAVIAEDAETKHSGDGRDSIVREADHQTRYPVPLEGPNKRRADAVSDLAGHFVNWLREFFVITQEIAGNCVCQLQRER